MARRAAQYGPAEKGVGSLQRWAGWGRQGTLRPGRGGGTVEPLDFKARPASSLPVPFFALGLVGFCALATAVALLPRAIHWPLHAHGVFLLHLAVLGWLTPVMMGADLQLVPVVLHRPLRGPRLGALVFWVYAAGATVFLAGWASAHPGWIALGGAAAGAALLTFCGQMAVALAGLRRISPPALGLAGGLLFLVANALLGPWMALAIGQVVAAPMFATLRELHAIAGLAGWILLTIMGATYQLVPFFAASAPGTPARFGTVAVAAAGLGALALFVSGLTPAVPPQVGVSCAALGMAMWLYDLARMVRRGRQSRREPVVAFSLAAAGAVALGGAAAVLAWRAGAPDLTLAACVVGLVAGPSLLILGQLQKILPLIASLDAALAAKRRGRVPKTEELFPRRRAAWLLGLAAAGFLAEAIGVAVPSDQTLRAGSLTLLVSALLYGGQQARAFCTWAKARQQPSKNLQAGN